MITFNKLSSIYKRWLDALGAVMVYKPDYRYGGEDPLLGLDCSGLVAYVLGRAGYPSRIRRTADGYMTQVFSAMTPPAALGEYAHAFCAYGFWDDSREGGAGFTHIALPFCGSLMADVSSLDRARVFPATVLAIGEPHAAVLAASQETSIRRSLDERFWDVASLVASCYINRSNITDAVFHTGCDFDDVVGGSALPRTSAMMLQITDWRWNTAVMAHILSMIYGRDERMLYYELSAEEARQAASGIAESTLYWLGPKFQRMIQGIVYSQHLNGGVYYDFMSFWASIMDDIESDTPVSMLKSGFSVRDRADYTVGTGDLSYRIHYLPEATLNSFLESEAYELLPPEGFNSKLQTLPCRKVM